MANDLQTSNMETQLQNIYNELREMRQETTDNFSELRERTVRLETKVSDLAGENGNPGKVKNLEAKVEKLNEYVSRQKGALGLMLLGLGAMAASFKYWVTNIVMSLVAGAPVNGRNH